MNSFVIFLPITIMLVIILVIGALLTKMKIWRPKRTLSFSGIYFGLGIVALIGVVILSRDSGNIESDKVLREHIVENERINEQVSLRNVDAMNPAYLKYTKTFEPTSQDIEVKRHEDAFFTRIVLTWNNSTENKIVASYYETPLFMNRVNISDVVRPSHIELKGNELFVYDVKTQIKVNSVRPKLEIIDDFQNTAVHDDLSNLIGERILHLNVPRHFNIIDSSGWME